MHRNEIIYALICINNHVLLCLISMLSLVGHIISIMYKIYPKGEEENGCVTRRDREVVDFTRSCVKNNTKLTNFGKLTQIEWHNGK